MMATTRRVIQHYSNDDIYNINYTSIKECLSENSLNTLKPLLVLTPGQDADFNFLLGQTPRKQQPLSAFTEPGAHFHAMFIDSKVIIHNQTPDARLDFNTVNSRFPQTQQSRQSLSHCHHRITPLGAAQAGGRMQQANLSLNSIRTVISTLTEVIF